MKVLVTGFEPFSAYPENVSWEVARGLDISDINGVELNVELLPVSFQRVAGALRTMVERHSPDLLIMLGQAGTADSIRLERVALNMMDARIADNDGYQPNEEPIVPMGNGALFTQLPIKRLHSAIEGRGIRAKISNSCGLYVCNRLYYEALQICQIRPTMQAIFIHLPHYTAQQGVAPERITMPLGVMTEVVKTIIQTIYENFKH